MDVAVFSQAHVQLNVFARQVLVVLHVLLQLQPHARPHLVVKIYLEKMLHVITSQHQAMVFVITHFHSWVELFFLRHAKNPASCARKA